MTAKAKVTKAAVKLQKVEIKIVAKKVLAIQRKIANAKNPARKAALKA